MPTPTLRDIARRLDLLARAAACVLAGLPPTSLIPLPLTMLLTPRFGREALLSRLHLMVPWARFCRRHMLAAELDVRGREHLPRPSHGHLYVSNHQSWVDILILMEALDTVAFLSKTLVRWIPVIGRCAYAGGSIFVRRNDPESRRAATREMIRMCRESVAVVLFPEGTRSPDGELQPQIHTSGLRAAYAHGLRAVPLGVDGTSRVVPKSMDRVNRGQRVAVTIGAPLDPRQFTDADAWCAAVWGQVEELFAASRARLAR